MKKANIVVGIIGIALSAYVIQTASGFPENNSAVDPGAAYFPTVMAAFLGIMCLILIVMSVMGKGADVNEKIDVTRGTGRAGIGCILFVIYCLLYKKAGFVIDTIWFCFVTMILLQSKKYVKNAIISVLTAVAIYFIFAHMLGAKLPAGLLKGLL